MTVSLAEARRIVLRAQGLAGGWDLPAGKEGAARVVDRLGYVQIDTIAVIERAHHHVLWTRHPGYRPAMLWELLGRDRRVFEGWTHAAAFIPIDDYRFYIRRTRWFAERPKTQKWLRENRAVVEHARERIRAEGPLRSVDFKDSRDQRGPWWDWKPAKRALEILFDAGELMIAERHNFQRVYDLTERVLPPEVDTTEPSPAQIAQFVVRRTLQSQGIIPATRVGWWLKDRKHVAAALDDLVQSGDAVLVRIDGHDGEMWYASTRHLEAAASSAPVPRRVRLLSPFDNLVIDRQRTLDLFGFDYRLECYTPASKRRYGYFTLPILWGDKLVGRLDPKVDRKSKVFYVRHLALEPDRSDLDVLYPILAQALRDFAAFHGCERITVERVIPDGGRTALAGALKG